MLQGGNLYDYITSIESAVIRNHEHDLPFHDIIINEAAAYAWNVFVGLHLLELAAKKAGCC